MLGKQECSPSGRCIEFQRKSDRSLDIGQGSIRECTQSSPKPGGGQRADPLHVHERVAIEEGTPGEHHFVGTLSVLRGYRNVDDQ